MPHVQEGRRHHVAPTNRPTRKPRCPPDRYATSEPVEYEDQYDDYDDYDDEDEPDEVDNTTTDADTPEVVDRFECTAPAPSRSPATTTAA